LWFVGGVVCGGFVGWGGCWVLIVGQKSCIGGVAGGGRGGGGGGGFGGGVGGGGAIFLGTAVFGVGGGVRIAISRSIRLTSE